MTPTKTQKTLEDAYKEAGVLLKTQSSAKMTAQEVKECLDSGIGVQFKGKDISPNSTLDEIQAMLDQI